jgi:hypothetical protein
MVLLFGILCFRGRGCPPKALIGLLGGGLFIAEHYLQSHSFRHAGGKPIAALQ